MQGLSAFGQHSAQLLIVEEDLRCRALLVGELAVDGVEELDQIVGVRSRGPDTALVVVDLVEDQVEVAFLFLGADFGEELRLGAAGA
jgi:hypothetical protein